MIDGDRGFNRKYTISINILIITYDLSAYPQVEVQTSRRVSRFQSMTKDRFVGVNFNYFNIF